MIHTPPEAIMPQFLSLVTGHFAQDGSYSTWRTNGTRDYLLILTLSGHGRFGFQGGEVETEAGDFILLAPGTPHDYRTRGAHWELLWAHFHPLAPWHAFLHWPLSAPGVMLLQNKDMDLRRNAERAFWQAHRFATGAGRSREAFAMNALEQTLLWCDAALPRQTLHDERVQAAMDFLCREMGQPIGVQDAARAARLSASRLAHLFKAQTGVSVGQFLEARRLERARQLLSRTGMTIGAIAADVGYDNPFYFTLRFKAQAGQSPTEFRRARQAEESGRQAEESETQT